MLRLFSTKLPEVSRAGRAQYTLTGLRAVAGSNTLPVRQYAAQPAPSSAETVSRWLSLRHFMFRLSTVADVPTVLQRTTKILINGEFRDSETSDWIDLKNPVCITHAQASCALQYGYDTQHMTYMQATQEVVTRVPIVTNSEFEEAVQAAKDAFPAWKRTPVPHRQRVMLKLQQLIRENMVKIPPYVAVLHHVW